MAIIKKGLGSLLPPQGGGRKLPFPPGTPLAPFDPWGPGGCPHPEEEILLADDSWIKAKDIKTGDKVKTLTAEGFKEGEYEITRVEIIDNQPRCEVFFKDSKSIISSYSHPYAVENKGFVEAQDIKVGDTVGDLIVTEVKPLDWGSVVSLSVDEAETYMLKGGSEDKPVAVLSHNKSIMPPREPPRPPITEPVGPRPPRPPGVSLGALKRKRQILREQLRQIEAQIRSLMDMGRPPWGDFDPEPPRPDIPWGDPPPKMGPPTMPGPGTPPPTIVGPPPSVDPGTPVPPPPPWKTDPPWGG